MAHILGESYTLVSLAVIGLSISLLNSSSYATGYFLRNTLNYKEIVDILEYERKTSNRYTRDTYQNNQIKKTNSIKCFYVSLICLIISTLTSFILIHELLKGTLDGAIAETVTFIFPMLIISSCAGNYKAINEFKKRSVTDKLKGSK